MDIKTNSGIDNYKRGKRILPILLLLLTSLLLLGCTDSNYFILKTDSNSPGTTDHNALFFLNWANAGHYFDGNLDLNNFYLVNYANDFSSGGGSFIDTNAQTACDAGEVLMGDGTCASYSAGITYLPSSVATINGTNLWGGVADINVIFDDLNYGVRETTGATPLTIDVNFTGVTDFDFGVTRIWYDGGSNHYIDICLWNYTSSDWDCAWDVEISTGFDIVTGTVFGSNNYIDSGLVQMRYNHFGSGNTFHYFYIDYVALSDGGSIIISNEHDALSGRNSTTNHPWALPYIGATSDLNMYDRNVSANYFIGDGSQLTGIVSGGGVNIGSVNQIPFVNNAQNDLNYSSNLIWDGTKFNVKNVPLLVTNTGIGSAVVNERTDGTAALFSAGGAALYFAGDEDFPMRFAFNPRANVLSGGLAFPVAQMGIGINTDRSIIMPAVYADVISGTTRDLYIKDDGQLGYLSSTIDDKRNIEEKTTYTTIYDLAPKQYDRKDGSSINEVGLIAEEVINVMPEIVSYKRTETIVGRDVDGYPIIEYGVDLTKPETVNYSMLIMPLLIEVQNLREENDLIKTELCKKDSSYSWCKK